MTVDEKFGRSVCENVMLMAKAIGPVVRENSNVMNYTTLKEILEKDRQIARDYVVVSY